MFLQCASTMHHKHHASHSNFKKRFLWCSLFTIPILIISPLMESILGFSISFPGDQWLVVLFSTGIFLYGGLPFITGLKQEIGHHKLGMMTLVGFAILMAYGYSLAVACGLPGESFWLELTTLIDIMLLGHWIESRTIVGASQTLERLALLLPSIAHKKNRDDTFIDVEAATLQVNDIIIVKPGEKISADGVVIEGTSEVNQMELTGEMAPLVKTINDHVIAGALNISGALTIKVTKAQQDAYLTRVIQLVGSIMDSKSRSQDLADKAAFVLTVIALGVGMLTFLGWLVITGLIARALEYSVTVMITTCPHALGLAIPLVIVGITSRAAQKGILIRNRIAFEKAGAPDIVIFDKTGTLTTGTFSLTDYCNFGMLNNESLLARVAALEQYARHNIAQAIIQEAARKNIPLPRVTKSSVIPGKGVRGTIDDVEYFVGNLKILEEISTQTAQEDVWLKLKRKAAYLSDQGKTIVIVITSQGPEGIIALEDTIHPQAMRAINELKSMGIDGAMMTGDNQIAAQAIGYKIGINRIFANVLPHEKAERIRQFQQEGKIVAMVGDGVNDAPALVASDIGIAIGSGTDIAIESADVVLVKNDPYDVVDVIKLSRLTRRKIIQNLFWATGYNIIMIPLATGLLMPLGVGMDPAIGALLMSLSAIIVAINARLI